MSLVFTLSPRLLCSVAPVTSVVSHSATSRTAAQQAALSTEFSRPEYWNVLPFPSPEGLPNPETEPASPALTGGFSNHWATGEAPPPNLLSAKLFPQSNQTWCASCENLQPFPAGFLCEHRFSSAGAPCRDGIGDIIESPFSASSRWVHWGVAWWLVSCNWLHSLQEPSRSHKCMSSSPDVKKSAFI